MTVPGDPVAYATVLARCEALGSQAVTPVGMARWVHEALSELPALEEAWLRLRERDQLAAEARATARRELVPRQRALEARQGELLRRLVRLRMGLQQLRVASLEEALDELDGLCRAAALRDELSAWLAHARGYAADLRAWLGDADAD